MFNLSLLADIQYSMSVLYSVPVWLSLRQFLPVDSVQLSVVGIAIEIDIMLFRLVGQICRVHDEQPRSKY